VASLEGVPHVAMLLESLNDWALFVQNKKMSLLFTSTLVGHLIVWRT